MLSDRRQRVLYALIEEYVARAFPVGSRTLTERYKLGVSPATVRNDLSALEDAGYITQPHTSAGRIPTDAGYRAFVDDLMNSAPFDNHPFPEVVAQLRHTAGELDDLMAATSAALTKLTDCLSIVVAPALIASHIRQFSLISLSNYQALVVIVAEDGQVVNRQISFNEEVTPDALAEVQRLLNDIFAGKSMADMKRNVEQDQLAALQDPLTQIILEEVILGMNENNLGKTHRLGMSALLRKPEFSTSEALLPVIQVLEDNTVILKIVDDMMNAEGDTMVRIGHENAAEEFAGVSVIAGQYGRGEGAGVVAVIGPTRMDYNRVLGAVRAARSALQDE